MTIDINQTHLSQIIEHEISEVTDYHWVLRVCVCHWADAG